MTISPRLSVIIPCRDDSETLAKLLPQIAAHELVEIIVVSSAVGNVTVERLCTKFNAQCVVLNDTRGARLSRGAKLARAPNLWFLHADSVIDDTAISAVVQAFDDGWIGGYFRFHLLGPRTIGKRWIEFTVALRCRMGGIPYGDQGLFVTAAEYQCAGGHEPIPLFDEFRLVRHLMRDNRFHLLPLAVGVDARRWEKSGFTLHTLRNRFFSLAYSFGVSPERLARWYYRN